MAAAAHVHHQDLRPRPVHRLLPIPAMSMVSHCVGTRFIQLIGGVMTSFYDWYADLPVASPRSSATRPTFPNRATGGMRRT